jgi:hypothetical protein
MAKSIGRVVGWTMSGLGAALLTAGCSRVHDNERDIIESTPNAETAPYAESREAYRDHMQDRFKNLSKKTYGKQTPAPGKAKKK